MTRRTRHWGPGNKEDKTSGFGIKKNKMSGQGKEEEDVPVVRKGGE